MDYTERSFGYDKKKTHYDLGLRKYVLSVYKYMALALGLTGIIALGSASSEQFMYAIHTTGFKWIIMFAPLAMVFYMSSRLMHMSITSAQTCLMIFSALMDYHYLQSLLFIQGKV